MKSHAKYLIPTLTLLLVFLVLSMSNAPDPMEGGGRGPSSVPMLPERSIWDGIKNLLEHHEAEVLAQGYIPPTGGQGVYPTSGTFSVGIQNTPGVLVQNTVYVTGVPAGGGGGGTVFVGNTAGVAVVSMPSMIVTGTVNVNIVAGAVSGGTVFVNNPNQSPIPIATGSANFFVNVQAGATIPVSVPTIGVAINTAGIIAIPTQSYDVNVKNTPGVAVQNTVSIATPTYNVNAFINGTPAIQGSVSINNTPAVQGSVSINNTPQVQFATADPCENPGIAKSFVALSTASATTSPIVAVSGSQAVYVCGFSFSQPQGVGTVGVQFMNAVNTPCSSMTPLTGIYALGLTHPGGYTVFKAAQSLCIQKTGAGVDPEGGLTYVQE
jgi:hypothetical protein